MKEIFERIQQIVAMQFEIQPQTVYLESHLLKDLGGDSIDLIMIIVEIENTYGVVIDEETLSELTTPTQIIQAIHEWI